MNALSTQKVGGPKHTFKILWGHGPPVPTPMGQTMLWQILVSVKRRRVPLFMESLMIWDTTVSLDG